MKAKSTNQPSPPSNRPPLIRPPRLHRPKPKKNPSKAEVLASQAATEGKFIAELTQFVYPTGAEQKTTTKLPIEGAAIYKEMTDAGYRFVLDFLSRDRLTISITNGKKHAGIREVELNSTKRTMLDMLTEASWK